MVGTEVTAPVINEPSLRYNFTNEGGACDTFRFSRNVMGLWLVQECRRTWAHQGETYSYDELTEMAARSEPFLCVIDPDHEEFFKPGDMPVRIQDFCRTTGQPVPASKGAILRCALEGIALKYRWVLERLEEMLGHRLEPLYIVGGGTQNKLLSQFTADAIDRQVITGPVEATATGNILMQMVTLGQIDSLPEGRLLVRNSFDLSIHEPGIRSGWDEAYMGFLQVAKESGEVGARMTLYRFHVLDPVFFKTKLKVTMQALGWRGEGRFLPLQDDISSIVYYYQSEPHAALPALPDRNGREII